MVEGAVAEEDLLVASKAMVTVVVRLAEGKAMVEERVEQRVKQRVKQGVKQRVKQEAAS